MNEWLEKQFIKNAKIDVCRVSHACMLIEACHGTLSIEQLT
jgi:hypothetical protein